MAPSYQMGYLVLLVDKRHMFGASYQSYTFKKMII